MANDTNSSKKHKILKWLAGIFIFIFLAVGGMALYLSNKWKPMLKTAIENTVLNASDGLYKIKISDINVNLIGGSAFLDSIEIYPDTAVYRKMISQRIAPENIFELKIRKLDLENIKPWDIYFKRNLDMDAISIREPELKITYNRFKNKIRKRKDNKTNYESIKDILNSAKVNSIFLNNIRFQYVDNSLAKPSVIKVDQLSIRANDILIDSASQYDSTRIFNAKDLIAELHSYRYATADSTYYIKLGKLRLSTLQKELLLSKVELVPRYEEMAFSNLFPKQHELYRINFDSILVQHLNYPDLIESRQIAAKSLSIKNGELYAFLNRGKPLKGIDKGENFPHVLLNKLNWNIIADKVNIKNVDINYAEYNPNSKSKGVIRFKNLNGNILNVTNDSVRLSKNKFANAYLNTAFMGYGNLNIHIKFDVSDRAGRFSYSGSVGAMPLSAINPISKPLAKILFSSGKLNRIDFSASGDRNGAKGKVKINYSDLSIKLLKQDSDNAFKRMGLISLLANALIIKSENPSKDEEIRISYPTYERPDDGSFFNLMWKIIFLGFKESLGITKEKETEMIEKSQKLLEKTQKKEARKEKRQQKREARKND
jgi:hypothetical protein